MADHNTVKFRDMKNYDIESFSNFLILCDILNGSHDNNDISWEMWKLAYNDICDKHVLIEKCKTKKTIKFMDDPWYHKAYVWTRVCDHVQAKATQSND